MDVVIRSWSRFILFLFNIQVRVLGLENLTNTNSVFIFNHTSNFDILALMSGIPRSLRFGAKAELFKIPFFGLCMSRFGMLRIYRGQREKVLRLYQESLKNLHPELQFILAPEGSRQETEKLGEFKSGPFILAISGQLPIVPVVIKGAYQVMTKKDWLPNTSRWATTIDIHILPAISTESFSMETRKELQNLAREMMQKELELHTK